MATNETIERPSDEDFAAVREIAAITGGPMARVLRYFLSFPPVEVPKKVAKWAESVEAGAMCDSPDVASRRILSLAAPPAPETPKPSFRVNTGPLGSTEPGQYVTEGNVAELPPGSVVRNGDGSRLIHLHGGLWLWCCDHGWCYDRIDNLKWRLDAKAVACHVAASDKEESATPPELPKPLAVWRKTRRHACG